MFEKKKSLYFIEKPIETKEKDLIGVSKQVEYIEENINNGAKFIGILSEYASGKSSITNKINMKQYKTIKVNLWRELKESGVNENIEELHKDFLYQLAMQTRKIKTQYLIDRYCNNGKKIKITAKTNGLPKLLVGAILNGIMAWLLYNDIGISLVLRILTICGISILNAFNIHSFILIFFIVMFLIFMFATIDSLIKNGILLSFWGTDTKSLTKSEMIELYNSIIGNNKNYLIIIEDLDRIGNCQLEAIFLREVYELYYKSNDKNIFVIECGKKSVNKNDIEKQFDVILECGEIDFTNSDVKLLESMLETKKAALAKIGINLKDEKIKWGLLSFGNDITIRKIKHRYNKAILNYETLKSRFNTSKIDLNVCLAVTYLRDEYKKTPEEELKKLINLYLEKYEKGDELKANTPLEDDIISFVKSEVLTEEYNRYTNNYPMESVYKTIDESNVYNLVLKNETNSIEGCIGSVNRLKNLTEIVIEALKRRNRIHMGLPEVLLDNERLFEVVVANKELKETFVEQFTKEKIETKVEYIRKIIDYNLAESFWTDLLKDRELNNYNFRNMLYQYPQVLENITSLKELFKNDDEPISIDEMKIIENVEKILKLIDGIENKDIQILKLNQIYEQLTVNELDNSMITVYVDELHVENKVENKDNLALLFVNLIENNSYRKVQCAVWLKDNLNLFNETSISRITDMLNNLKITDSTELIELIIKVATRENKYGLNNRNAEFLLIAGYEYEYLICKSLYNNVVEDIPSIDKMIYVKVFNEYYDGENLNISDSALIKIYDSNIIKDMPWFKLKKFVGVINDLPLYLRMTELVMEGNEEVLEYFDKYMEMSPEKDFQLATYICQKVQTYEQFKEIKDKIYNKLSSKSKTKLTKKEKSYI